MSINHIRVVETRYEDSKGSVEGGYLYIIKIYTRENSLYLTIEGKDYESLYEKVAEDIGYLAVESSKDGEQVIIDWI